MLCIGSRDVARLQPATRKSFLFTALPQPALTAEFSTRSPDVAGLG